MLVLLSLGVILLVPALTLQIVEVVRSLPGYVEQASVFLTEPPEHHERVAVEPRQPFAGRRPVGPQPAGAFAAGLTRSARRY